MKFTEEYMQKLSAPLNIMAESRCKNALNNVSAALKDVGYSHTASGELRQLFSESYSYVIEMSNGYGGRTIRIFTQGSYANNTNIEKTSDVDMAVVLESTFIMEKPQMFFLESGSQVRERYKFSTSDDSAIKLKDDVVDALQRYFGYLEVIRKNKSVKIKGNSTRTDCDTVPAIRNRDYTNDNYINENNYIGGIQIHSDDGDIIINYPEQHIENGVAKNNRTNFNYKKCVRALKNIRELMHEHGYNISSDISSFGLESLFWNASDAAYKRYSSLLFVFEDVLIDLENKKFSWSGFTEANGIKPLFNYTTQVNYIRFFDELRKFFKYDIN